MRTTANKAETKEVKREEPAIVHLRVAHPGESPQPNALGPKTPAQELEPLWTPEDLQKIFKVDITTLRMWRREHGLPFFRVKRNVRFLPSAVKEWFHTHHGPETAKSQPKAGA